MSLNQLVVTGDNPTEVKQGTTPTFFFQFKVENEYGKFEPLDLNGWTIVFKADYKEGAQAGTQKWEVTCTVTDESNGKFKGKLTSSNTDTIGKFIGEVMLTKVNDVYKSGDFKIVVRTARSTP